MNSKAQAGLEYLMTYGWAMILLVTTASLLWFLVGIPVSNDVFSSSVPTKILLKAGNISGTNTEMQLQNATGGSIKIIGISSNGLSNCVADSATFAPTVKAGGIMKINCISSGDRKGSVTLDYLDFAGQQKKAILFVNNGTTTDNVICGNTICLSGEQCTIDCQIEEYCADSIDNDFDGSTDCSDTDCFGDKACNSGELVAEYLFDEGSGPIVSDSSGKGNNGTIVNSPLWQTTGCPAGSCMYFDGIDDYITVPHSASLNISDDFSFSALIKIDELPPGGAGTYNLFGKWTFNPSQNGFFLQMGNTGRFADALGKNNSIYSFPCNESAILPGSWHNITFTASAAKGENVFLDGQLKCHSANFFDWSDNTSPFLIGRYSPIVTPLFKGYFDNIRIYNTDISP